MCPVVPGLALCKIAAVQPLFQYQSFYLRQRYTQLSDATKRPVTTTTASIPTVELEASNGGVAHSFRSACREYAGGTSLLSPALVQVIRSNRVQA